MSRLIRTGNIPDGDQAVQRSEVDSGNEIQLHRFSALEGYYIEKNTEQGFEFLYTNRRKLNILNLMWYYR